MITGLTELFPVYTVAGFIISSRSNFSTIRSIKVISSVRFAFLRIRRDCWGTGGYFQVAKKYIHTHFQIQKALPSEDGRTSHLDPRRVSPDPCHVAKDWHPSSRQQLSLGKTDSVATEKLAKVRISDIFSSYSFIFLPCPAVVNS